METHTTTTTTYKDKAMRAVAVLGLVAILVLGAWGIIQVAFVLWGFMGSLGAASPAANQNQAAQVVSVTAPQNITSGAPFTLSFNYPDTAAKYAYEISYACATGLSVKAPLPNGTTQTVPCNTPFNYTNASANIQLTATLTGKTQVNTAFIVAAKNLSTNTIVATGSANSMIMPGASTAPTAPVKKPATPSPNSTYVPSTSGAALYGLPDLAVYTGSVTNSGGRVNVQFTVQNIGTNTVPAGWTFNAVLPTAQSYTYPSGPQQALRPGDKIVYTLGFTMQNNYTYSNYTSNYNNYPYYRPTTGNCGYTTTYTYNGTYNEPRQTYQCNGVIQNTYPYNDYYSNQYGYNNYNYNNYQGGAVVVTADPNNYQNESSESNNTASINVGYY